MKIFKMPIFGIVILATAGFLTQCGSPVDLLENVERKVEEAHLGEIPPEAPSNLQASAASDTRIDITWEDNSDNEAGFQIHRDLGSGFEGIATVGADSTAYSDEGLSSDIEYIYRVRAVNSAGSSSWSNEAVMQPQDVISPAVEISSSIGTVTASTPIPFTVTFSEPVTGFVLNDIDITVDNGGISVGGFSSNTEGDEYSFQVTPDTDPSTVTVNIAADVAVDEAGNGNTSVDQPYDVIYSTAMLTVNSISSADPTNSQPVTLTIEFSEEVQGFDGNAVQLSNDWIVDTINAINNPIFLVNIIDGNEGTATVNIPADAVTAVSTGRGNQASAEYDFLYDSLPPDSPLVYGDVSPTADNTPGWTWFTGGNGGNGTYRYKLDNNNLSTGAEVTTLTTYTPISALSDGEHTLYVQERDEAGNWSGNGWYSITVTAVSVTYYPNGASGIPPSDGTSYHTGDNVTVAGTGTLVLVENGITFRFIGWNTLPNGGGTAYNPGNVFTITGDDVDLYAQWDVIGGTGPGGGLVFYDKESYSDGWRYIEAAPASEEAVLTWAPYGTNMSGTTSTAAGSGLTNTNNLINQLGAGPPYEYACQHCNQLTYGGRSDWYLPSRTSIGLMRSELYLNGLGGFSTSNYYWSSSGDDSTAVNAWALYFSSNSGFYSYETNENIVRPVRRF